MVENNLPIGSRLMGVSIVEYLGSGGSELLLDEIQLIFPEATVILKAIADTDEVEIASQPTTAFEPGDVPSWCRSFLGKKLQAIWICENDRGYRDQVIFAFDLLRPSLAFVAECSSLIAFRYEQIHRVRASRTQLAHSISGEFLA